ncbi:MAG: hypothetical protein AAFN81_13350 [Bacteroidota bacterium]
MLKTMNDRLLKSLLIVSFSSFSVLIAAAQERVLFLGDSCYVFEQGMFSKANGQWVEFDNRKDRLLDYIADSTLVVSDPTIEDFIYNDFENCIKKYSIKDGEYDSIYEVYFPDTIIQERGVYDSGRKIGTWERYNREGDIVDIERYDLRAGQIDWIEFEKGTSNKQKHLIYFYSSEGQEIVWILFNEDQSIEVFSKISVRGQEKWASKVDYYNSQGQLQVQGPSEKSNTSPTTWSEGYVELKYPNGQLKERRITWAASTRRLVEKWHENGNLESRGIQVKVKDEYRPDGDWIHYREDGLKEVEAEYRKGVRRGLWIYYDENGYLDKYESYSRSGKLKRLTKILLPNRDDVEWFTEVYYDKNGNYKGQYEMK